MNNSSASHTQLNSTGKLDQDSTFRLPTAKLHFLAFIGLGLLLYFSQQYLAGQVQNSAVVEIGKNSEEDNEMATEHADPFNGMTQESIAKIIDLADLLEALVVQSDNLTLAGEVAKREVNKLNENTRWRVCKLTIESLVKRKDYDRASVVLELLTENDISLAQLQFERAYLASKTGKTNEAIELYRALLNKNNANTGAVINLGRIYLKQNDPAKAIALLDSGLKSARGIKRSKVLTLRSDALFRQQDYQRALRDIGDAIELRPSVSYLWRRKAVILQALGNDDDALDSFHKATLLDGQSTLNKVAYADALTNRLQFYKAYKIWRQTYKIDKNDLFMVNALACLWFDRRKKLLRKRIEAWSKTNPDEHEKNIVDAIERMISGQWLTAQAKLKSTLKKNRDNTLAYILIAQTYRQLNKVKNEKLYLTKAVGFGNTADENVVSMKLSKDKSANAISHRTSFNNKPNIEHNIWLNWAKYQYIIAVAEREQDQDQQQLKSLIDELPVKQFQFRMNFELAETFYRLKRYTIVKQLVSRWPNEQQGKRKTQLLQGKLYWQQGMKDKAITTLVDLKSKNPNWPAVLYRLASYYRQIGELGRSEQSWQQLLDVDREYSDAIYQLARVKMMRRDLEGAIPLLTEFLQIKADHRASRLLLAEAECEINHIQRCNSQLDLLIRVYPKDKAVEALQQQFRYLKQKKQ